MTYSFGIAIVWNPKGFVKDSMISVLKSLIFVIFDGSAFANKGKTTETHREEPSFCLVPGVCAAICVRMK